MLTMIVVMISVIIITAKVVEQKSEQVIKEKCEDLNIPYKKENMNDLITTGRDVWDGKKMPPRKVKIKS